MLGLRYYGLVVFCSVGGRYGRPDWFAFKELSEEELLSFLTGKDKRYLAIYFSTEEFDNSAIRNGTDGKGIVIQRDIWRKKGIFMLHGPFMVFSHGMFYQMEYCSEYLDKDGNIVPKSAPFCALAKDFQKFSRKLLHK